MRPSPAKIKEFEARQAHLERDSVKSGYFPSLSLNASYSAISGDRQLLAPKESLLASASVNFILYDGGAMEARLDALKFSQNAKELRSLETKITLPYNLFYSTLAP
ncbi:MULTISPECIES: TolC family protein [unclassified Campylobacter]|uniref:TolC family protein n=1 Tax=unclassified Campylobacter TaxID=2593542 RepID=UPI003D3249A1